MECSIYTFQVSGKDRVGLLLKPTADADFAALVDMADKAVDADSLVEIDSSDRALVQITVYLSEGTAQDVLKDFGRKGEKLAEKPGETAPPDPPVMP